MPKKSKGSEGRTPDIKNHAELEMTEAEPATVINEDDSSEFSEILYERMNLVVSGGQEPIRLDKFLTARIENISRNKVQQAIDGGMVLVNNKAASANYKVRPGDNIVCFSDKEKGGRKYYSRKNTTKYFF
ncbi:MAG: S4 domain-containing protein [Puia sp.]